MTGELEEKKSTEVRRTLAWDGAAKAWTPALIALLIPIGVAALWIAKQGRHGDSYDCTIDVAGGLARYNWDEPIRTSRTESSMRYLAFDLATGRPAKQYANEGILKRVLGGGDDWIIKKLDFDRFQLIQFGEPATKVDFDYETDNLAKNRLWRLIDGKVLVAEYSESGAKLRLIDPHTSEIVDQVLIDSKVIDNFLPVTDSTYCGIIRTKVSGKGRLFTSCQFFRVHQGKIDLKADTGLELVARPMADEFGSTCVPTYSKDGKSIEVRSIDDDSLKYTMPAPPTAIQAMGPSWIRIGMPSEYIDLRTSRVLPVPSDFILNARDQKTKRLVVSKPVEGIVKIIDEVTGKEIANLPIHEPIAKAVFSANGEELWVATPSCRIHRINAISGEHLQVVDPYRNVTILEFLSAFLFFVWACLWVRSGAKVHRHAWLDCALITGLCVAYIIARSRLTGFSSDVIRPIYQLAEGIFASWLILTSLWLVLGRTRFTLRILPHLAISGIVIFLTLVCVGFGNSMAWELVIGVGLLSAWLIIVFVPLRLIGYKILSVDSINAEPASGALSKTAVPMRDIFLLTTVLAGLVALTRYTPPALAVTLRSVLDLFVLVFSVTLTGVTAVRFGLSQRTFTVRLLSLAVMAGIALSVPVLWQVQYQGWKVLKNLDWQFIYWETRLHSATAIAAAISLYTYRLRGWRLSRS